MPKNVFVAIVGRPNVGKSSLLNQLLGEKIAIVSDKPQTTRNRITGVLTRDETQYVFIDTPGMHKPKSKLGQFMVRQAGGSVADVDVAVLVTEWDTPIALVPRFSQSIKLTC
ncbi:MAG: GTPase Era [Oscillospiraceae bacterium]